MCDVYVLCICIMYMRDVYVLCARIMYYVYVLYNTYTQQYIYIIHLHNTRA